MWSERDRRYGGLQRRYKNFHGSTVRCLDPVSRKPVAFATELHYENWLLYWARPGVKNLDPSAPKLGCLDSGRQRVIVPDLQFDLQGIEIQLVVARDGPGLEVRTHTLQRVADAHGLRWAIRTRRQIREKPFLISNLDTLRQCSTLHADEPGQWVRLRVESLLSECHFCTLDQIKERVGVRAPDTLVDSVLIGMHRSGEIEIDLTGGAYGQKTRISSR